MANAVIKHFRRYKYLISDDVINLTKTKVEITSALSVFWLVENKWLAWALEMCKKLIDFRVLSIIGTPLTMALPKFLLEAHDMVQPLIFDPTLLYFTTHWCNPPYLGVKKRNHALTRHCEDDSICKNLALLLPNLPHWWFLVWFLFYGPSTQVILGAISYPNHTVPGQASWGSLPVLSAHSFASNWQLLFLNLRKRENGRRNCFPPLVWVCFETFCSTWLW